MGPENDEIFLTNAKQQRLVASFAATWNRAPTEPEFQAILEDWIREEIAYRQGVDMSLDVDDTVIRRRLRQKVELLAEEIVSMSPPEDAELEEYLSANVEDYIGEPSFTLRQIAFSIDERGETAKADAEQALVLLTGEDSSVDPDTLGDPIPLPRQMIQVTPAMIASRFGSEFTSEVSVLEPGDWHGPVMSGFGVHLVIIDEFIPPQAPELDEVRREVLRDYNRQEREAGIDRLYEELAKQYTISVEGLEDVESS